MKAQFVCVILATFLGLSMTLPTEEEFFYEATADGDAVPAYLNMDGPESEKGSPVEDNVEFFHYLM